MFTAKLIGFAIVALLVTNLLLLDAPEDNPKMGYKIIFLIGLLAGLYTLAAGVHLLGGWEDPFRNADPRQIAEISGRGRGRGFVMFLIRNWPYALIGFGFISSFNVLSIVVPSIFKKIKG